MKSITKAECYEIIIGLTGMVCSLSKELGKERQKNNRRIIFMLTIDSTKPVKLGASVQDLDAENQATGPVTPAVNPVFTIVNPLPDATAFGVIDLTDPANPVFNPGAAGATGTISCSADDPLNAGAKLIGTLDLSLVPGAATHEVLTVSLS